MKKLLSLVLLMVAMVVAVKDGQANQKVTICHNNHQITIDLHALQAHIKHGDQIGGCNYGDDPNEPVITF